MDFIHQLEDGSPQLYVMPIAGGDAKKIHQHFDRRFRSTMVSRWQVDRVLVSDVYPECSGDDACNKRIADTWAKGPLKAHTAESALSPLDRMERRHANAHIHRQCRNRRSSET